MKKLLAVVLAVSMLSTVAFALRDVTGDSFVYHHSTTPVDDVTIDRITGLSENSGDVIAYRTDPDDGMSYEDGHIVQGEAPAPAPDDGDNGDADAPGGEPAPTPDPASLTISGGGVEVVCFVTINPVSNAVIGPVLAK